MERTFKRWDIVKHFKRETLSEEELKDNPNKYLDNRNLETHRNKRRINDL